MRETDNMNHESISIEAKKLIEENNDLRIKDIADAVGFKESYYFSKTFKRETGMWPTEYSAQDK